MRVFAVAWLICSATTAFAQAASPPLVTPNFLPMQDPDVTDYRPVVSADGTMVIFERTFKDSPDVTKLYIANISTGDARLFVNIASFRADWCWLRSAGRLTNGPVAFSNNSGVFVVAAGATTPTQVPNTAGMIYPSWYPDCQSIATDVTTSNMSAKIDAVTGNTILSPLANDTVWAGFVSVNQVNPNLVAFAGQNNRESNYYNQNLNYSWVTDTSTRRPKVAPFDRHAPKGPGFLSIFQARAGWWSPDGKWFAFESNRICSDIDGMTYAVFIQEATGAGPAMQVTDCKWNAQHPKWFPPGVPAGKTMLIVAAQPTPNDPTAIATLDVSAFVTGR